MGMHTKDGNMQIQNKGRTPTNSPKGDNSFNDCARL